METSKADEIMDTFVKFMDTIEGKKTLTSRHWQENNE